MECTITLPEQTYRALQRHAARSQKAVGTLVVEWLKERLALEIGSVQYRQTSGEASVLRETSLVEQETITLELPSDLYDGLRSLGKDEQIDPVSQLPLHIHSPYERRIAGAIGAGSGQRRAQFRDDGKRNGVIGHPHRHRIPVPGEDRGEAVRSGMHHGQPARPEKTG